MGKVRDEGSKAAEKRFGEIIRKARRERSPRISQSEMASLIGMSESNYRKAEAGITGIRLGHAIRICQVLGIDMIKIESAA